MSAEKNTELNFFFETEEDIVDKSFLVPNFEKISEKAPETFDRLIKTIKKPKLVIFVDTSLYYVGDDRKKRRIFYQAMISCMKKFAQLVGIKDYATCFEIIIVDLFESYGRTIIANHGIKPSPRWGVVLFDKDGKLTYSPTDDTAKLDPKFETKENVVINNFIDAENLAQLEKIFNDKTKKQNNKKITVVTFQDSDFDNADARRDAQISVTELKTTAYVLGIENYQGCFNTIFINKSKEPGKSLAQKYGVADIEKECACFFDKDGIFSYPIRISQK